VSHVRRHKEIPSVLRKPRYSAELAFSPRRLSIGISFIRYRTTPLGAALFEHVRERMGLGGSQLRQSFIDAFSVAKTTSVSAAEVPPQIPSQEAGSEAQPSESS
jgi:hypothetical protein